MGFKSLVQYDDERYHDMLQLKDDGDYVDAVILYRGIEDALVCDAHYIKSSNFSGYVHCLGGATCPACKYGKSGIQVQNKLFIPLYIVDGPDKGKILFWDRNVSFNQKVLEPQVFSSYPNPSEFVFRITRHGVRNDPNTVYNLQAIGKNSDMSYDEILKSLNVKMPDHYETICKSWTVEDYNRHLNTPTGSSEPVDVDTMPSYKLTPREVKPTEEMPNLSDLDASQEADEINVDDVTF